MLRHAPLKMGMRDDTALLFLLLQTSFISLLFVCYSSSACIAASTRGSARKSTKRTNNSTPTPLPSPSRANCRREICRLCREQNCGGRRRAGVSGVRWAEDVNFVDFGGLCGFHGDCGARSGPFGQDWVSITARLQDWITTEHDRPQWPNRVEKTAARKKCRAGADVVLVVVRIAHNNTERATEENRGITS